MARGCLRVINNPSRTCFKCNKPSHFARECPNVKGTSLECFNGKKAGHMARNWPEKPNNGKGKEACKYCKKLGHHYDNCFARLAKVAESPQEKAARLNECFRRELFAMVHRRALRKRCTLSTSCTSF